MNRNKFSAPIFVFGELGLIYCVAREGIPIYLGADEWGVNQYSRFPVEKISVPAYHTKAFIDKLIQLGKSFDYKPVILSYDDRLLLNISRHRDLLKPHYKFLFPEYSMVEKLLDKQLFGDLKIEYDLPIPLSVNISSRQDVEQAVQILNPPYILKPAQRHFWYHKDFESIVGTYYKAYVCKNEEQLVDLYARIARIHPKAVAMEFIKGDDNQMYDVNAYVDKEGRMRGYAATRKYRVFPPTAGWGSYVITIENQMLFEKTKEFLDRLHLKGLLNFQFKVDAETGEWMLIEIHIRNSIFDVLAARVGANLPLLYYKELNDIQIPAYSAAKSGAKYMSLGRDLKLFFKYRDDIQVSFWEWIRSYHHVKVFHDFNIYDPKPFLEKVWRPIKQKMSKIA